MVELPIVPAAGTKVLIVKFSDYMCPSCKSAHDAFKPVLAKYQGQPVEFVLKHYPLEPECNINTPGMDHYGSCEAAAAYEMAKGNPNQARLDDWLPGRQRLRGVAAGRHDILGLFIRPLPASQTNSLPKMPSRTAPSSSTCPDC